MLQICITIFAGKWDPNIMNHPQGTLHHVDTLSFFRKSYSVAVPIYNGTNSDFTVQ